MSKYFSVLIIDIVAAFHIVQTPPKINAATAAKRASAKKAFERQGMVFVPAGTYFMGCSDPAIADARPVHLVSIRGFWMDRTEVTNKEFERFVNATHYQTDSERTGGALVFKIPDHPVSMDSLKNWWTYKSGASWRHPEGPESNLEGRWEHPVVEVTWDDANAYAKWACKRLPTEAEYEYASRGGLDRRLYSWGDNLTVNGRWQANIWQGKFPWQNSAEDGFVGSAPVASFPPNNYGLFDTTGNVWEWCSDWYRPNYIIDDKPGAIADNPIGPTDGFDPAEPRLPKRVLRGGSFLCCHQYCSRYAVGARGEAAPRAAASNVGFRCVAEVDPN